MTDTLTDMEERDALAGELALRVLSSLEEVKALARAESDPAFAAEVEAWNERLAAFMAEVAPVQPSAGVWSRLESATTGAANDDGRKVAFWRTWAIGATTLLAASLGAVAFMVAQPAPVAPIPPTTEPVPGVTRLATLSLETGPAVLTLAYDTRTGALFIAPTPELAEQSGVPHLWLVDPAGGVRLIGPIDGAQTSRVNLTQVLSGLAGQATAVAISIEAPGTVPAQDTPAGPVVASGELQRL